jgi:hypothetical protein
MEAARLKTDLNNARSNVQIHEIIEEIRENQEITINRLNEAQKIAEQRRPLANGISEVDILEALEHEINLNVSMLVVSKAKKSLGQHVSLLRHTLNPTNANIFMRSCLNDLMTLKDQADHSFNGSVSKLGAIPVDIENLLKGKLGYHLIIVFIYFKILFLSRWCHQNGP